jgi:hypothetical protein
VSDKQNGRSGSDHGRHVIVAATSIMIATTSSFVARAVPAASVDRAEPIPASDTPARDLFVYRSNAAGVILNYPRGWKIVQHPDKNCVVKFQGAESGFPAEVTLLQTSEQTQSAQDTAKLFELVIFPKLENFKKLQEKKISFGPKHSIEGVMIEISLSFANTPVNQRYVFFQHSGKSLVLTFTGSTSTFPRLTPLYNDILLSVQSIPTSAVESAELTGSNGSSSTPWTQFHSKTIPLRFSYPAGWMVEERDDPDHPLEITNKDNAGRIGSIAWFSNEWNNQLNLEQVAQAVDSRYLANKPAYRQIKLENINFGAGGCLDGLVREASFEEHGVPAKQFAVFFRDKDRLHVLTFASIGWKDNASAELFHKLLATVETE